MKQKIDQKTPRAARKPYQPRKRKTNTTQTTVSVDDTPAPTYEVPEESEAPKPVSFSRIVANDDILVALEKSSYRVPSELLMQVVPATLRGSDTLIYKTKQPEGFLIGIIAAVAKLSSSEKKEKTASELQILQPSALFLFPTKDSVKSALALTQEVFQNFEIQFACLEPETQNADVLFATPADVLEAQKNEKLNLNYVQLVCIHELHLFEGADAEALHTCMSLVSSEKVQKIATSYENTPKIREFAFKFFEDAEIFSFLPTAITPQFPRQFAHALEVTKKFQTLLGYLKTYKPRAALVVANTRTVAEWITFKLHGNNVRVCALTAPLSPYQKRVEFLNSVAKGDIHVVVATDDAIKNFGLVHLNCVYHFDLPENPQLYIERVNKTEGARNPISIAFVCEDYGFNMGKIEETLGFSVKVTTPDRNFANFKDKSDYPLESNGRVKSILTSDTAATLATADTTLPQAEKAKPAQMDATPERTARPSSDAAHERPAKPSTADATHERSARPAHSDSTHARPTRSAHGQNSQSNQARTSSRSQQTETTSDHATTGSARPKTPSRHYQPDTSKFVRRDERAQEVVAEALLAAKMAEEKRKAENTSQQGASAKTENTSSSDTQSQQQQKQDNSVSALFGVFKDALNIGVSAAKTSLMQNTKERFPAIYKFFNGSKNDTHQK